MNQTKGFLFFGCFLLVAGLAFVLVFALRGGFGPNRYDCDLVALEPSWPHSNTATTTTTTATTIVTSRTEAEVKNFVSKDNKMIANFEGFIKFIHFEEMLERVYYLPLSLIGLRHTPIGEHNLLVLETECANLELLIHQDTSSNTTTVKQVLVFWHKPYRSYNHCYVQTLKLDRPANTHYACDKQEMYDCAHSADIDVWDRIVLVTNRLEFEINGEPNELAQGYFSTVPVECPP